MAEPLADKVIQGIEQVRGIYHRLILLVAPPGGGKTAVLQDVAQRNGLPVINLNLELCKRMLELTVRQRTLQLPRLLSDIVQATQTDGVLFDNIEVLFDVSLKNDPLKLLQGISRNKTVVAAWNGSADKEHVTYATPDHPEYKRYPVKDLFIVTPEGC